MPVLRGYLALPRWLRTVLAVGTAGTIWWLSSRQPTADEPGGFGFSFLHNCAHIVAYSGLGAAVLLALTRWQGWQRWHPRLAVLLTALYGVVDELHQSYVPGRTCAVTDATTDLLAGVLASCFLGWRLTGSRSAMLAVPWLFLAALASASAATLLPW